MEPTGITNNNFTDLLFDSLSYKKNQYRKATLAKKVLSFAEHFPRKNIFVTLLVSLY